MSGLVPAMSDGTESPVAAAFAIHITSALPTGWVSTRGGPVMASADTMAIRVVGRGGHASEPHRALDPIPVACEIVQALQTMVTRSIDVFDPAVVTVGRISAGTTNNVIPHGEHVTIAYGRDYDDVSPISGVLLGGGAHTVEVAVDVERHAVKAGAAANAQADAGELDPIHVDARRIAAAGRFDAVPGAQVDDALFQAAHEIAHAQARAPQIDERVDHELAGSVVGHLAAAVDLDHRDVAGREQVFRLGVEPERKHALVLAEPDLVGRRLVASVGEFLHRPPDRFIDLQAEFAHDGLAHSAINTSSWDDTSR